MVSDIVEIAKSVDDYKKAKNPSKFEFDSDIKNVRKINDLYVRYYLRFSSIDRPGVLADISSILAENKISISTVSQKERKKGQPVPLVMLTHEANEGSLNKALDKITKLSSVTKKPVRIRIER